MEDKELNACTPIAVNASKFNPNALLPYGLEIETIEQSMADFIDFLGFINVQLKTKNMPRLECFLMPANFSSIVGEFMNINIPKHCKTLVKNKYHNGHPDLVPIGMFPNDAVLHATEGVEIKSSRHASGWQGHNPEQIHLMVFNFDSNTADDFQNNKAPKSFKFKGVYIAKLELEDWTFSGRSETSRRTITATVNKLGTAKMFNNWVYKDV